MKRLRFPILVLFLISYMVALTSCADKSADISILSDTDVFYQANSVNNKLDILWMMDSSGSMAEEQQNLSDNFNAFITDFVTKGYDYNIAVAATDAWRYEYSPSTYQNLVRFRDGNIYTGTTTDNTGVFMLTPSVFSASPNPVNDMINAFKKNIKVGITGNGDERAFDSIRETLKATQGSGINSGYNFRRNDAFLAIIIISDEEDFSRNNSNVNGCTGSPTPVECQDQNLRPVSDYVSYLDTYTSSTPTDRKYSVNAIGVFDSACLAANPSSEGHMGLRYMDLADETNGVTGSICDSNFSQNLNDIQSRIAELSTQFRLSRTPIVSSIVVIINGVSIPQNPTNGWTYNATNNSVVFHGSAIPAQGAAVSITFDPTTLN